MQRVARCLRAQHQCLAVRHRDIALPVQLDAVTDGAAVAIVRVLGGGDGAAIGQPQRLVEASVPQHQMRGGAGLILHGGNTGAGRRRERREGHEIEGVAGDLAQAVQIAPGEADVEIVGQIEAQLGGGGEIVIKIIVAALTRRQKIFRRHRRGAGMNVLQAHRVMHAAIRNRRPTRTG